MSFRYLSVNQLNELTGKDRRTIKKLLEGLKVHPGSGNGHYYDAQEALPRIFNVSSSKEEKKSLTTQLMEEQLRHEQAKSESLELKLKQSREELVSVEDVSKTWSDIATRVKTKVLGIAAKMKQRHSELSLGQVATLELLSREALEEVANGEQQNTSL